MGKVLCCHLDFSSCTGHLYRCTYLEGPQRAKGHVKDYELGANSVVLLSATFVGRLCNICGQRVCSPQEPFGEGGGEAVFTRRKSSMRSACGASTPPWEHGSLSQTKWSRETGWCVFLFTYAHLMISFC